MAIPTSTVATVLDYLNSNITTQINDTSVRITYGPPGTFLEDDVVAIGEVITWDGVPHAFVGSGGTHWMQETYRVQVVVRAFRGGDDATTVYKRAQTLSDAVDAVVRTDPTLGGAVQLAYPITGTIENGWDDAHMGRMTVITKEIYVEAEI